MRDLGVHLDAELTLKHRVNLTTRSCFFQIRRLRQYRRLAGPDITTKRVVCALILGRLDYCKAALELVHHRRLFNLFNVFGMLLLGLFQTGKNLTI